MTTEPEPTPSGFAFAFFAMCIGCLIIASILPKLSTFMVIVASVLSAFGVMATVDAIYEYKKKRSVKK